jgi:hypothetical protein
MTTRGTSVIKPNKATQTQWRELERLERKIAASDSGGILERWNYGVEVLKAKAGKRKLPDGMLAGLVAAAGMKKDAKGNEKPKISERDIRYRVQFAEVYPTEAHVRQIIAEWGLWSEIIAAGFPEVVVDETPSVGDVLDDIEGGAGDPQEFEQPGLFPDLVKKIPLPVSPLRNLVAYAEEMRGMTASYAKRDDERQAHLLELTIAAGGDLDVTYQDAMAMLRAKQMAASST